MKNNRLTYQVFNRFYTSFPQPVDKYPDIYTDFTQEYPRLPTYLSTNPQTHTQNADKKGHFCLKKCPFPYFTVDEGGFSHTYPLNDETYPHFKHTCNNGCQKSEVRSQKSELSDTSKNTPITCNNCSAFGLALQFLVTFVTPLC